MMLKICQKEMSEKTFWLIACIGFLFVGIWAYYVGREGIVMYEWYFGVRTKTKTVNLPGWFSDACWSCSLISAFGFIWEGLKKIPPKWFLSLWFICSFSEIIQEILPAEVATFDWGDLVAYQIVFIIFFFVRRIK